MHLDEFLNTYPFEVRVLLDHTRSALLDRFTSLREEPDLPSRIVVYRIAPGNDGVVFTLIPSRAGVKLGIYRGRELADPTGLLQGSGKVHATIPLTESSFDDQAFNNLLDTAMSNAQLRITRRT
jgi:hypothetical protein